MTKLFVCPFLYILCASQFAASAQESSGWDLNGLWVSGGSKFLITHKGNHVEARFVSLNEEARAIGFTPGDLSFFGTFDGDRVKAKFHRRYPLKYKQSCPKQWDSFADQVLVVSEEGDRLSTRWRQSLIYPDCSEGTGPWKTTIFDRELVRAPQKIVVVARPERISPPVSSHETPTRIRIDVGTPSATTNESIRLYIGLAGRHSARVFADRDYQVSLSAKGGSVNPDEVTIAKGASEARAALQAATPGDVEVSGKSKQKLQSASEVATFCDTTEIGDLYLASNAQEVPADGKTPIKLLIRFVDRNGAATTGQQSKPLSVQPDGVGTWRSANSENMGPGDWTASSEECVLRPELVSAKPGKASVDIGFRTMNKHRAFSFYAPLTTVLVIWTIVGAIGGTFVRIFQTPYRRRSLRYYILQFVTGALAGIAFFLAFYFGLVALAPSTFPGGSAIGFFLGLIGGYLGSAALDSISKVATQTQPPGAAEGA